MGLRARRVSAVNINQNPKIIKKVIRMVHLIWIGNCSECNARIYYEFEDVSENDEDSQFLFIREIRECGFYFDEHSNKKICSYVNN